MNENIRRSMEVIKDIYINDRKMPVYGTKEEPLFLAVDIARMLDYSNGRTYEMLDGVRDSDKILLSTRGNNSSARGNASQKWFLTERGLHQVLYYSRKPIARVFQDALSDIIFDLRREHEETYGDWYDHDYDLDDYEVDAIYREDHDLPEISYKEFLETRGYTK